MVRRHLWRLVPPAEMAGIHFLLRSQIQNHHACGLTKHSTQIHNVAVYMEMRACSTDLAINL